MQDNLKDKEMRTRIRDTASIWRNVTNGVLETSILAPIMFQIYVNDMQCSVINYINLFADDAQLMKVI